MPISTLQRQFRELGRLRMGIQVPNKGKPGTHPAKLDTWRLTSPQRDLLDRAAAVYEGEVRPWKDGRDGDAFELITTATALRILIPPGAPLTQWNEMWGGGGCLRRCDGETEFLSGKRCLCPAEPLIRNELASRGEACKPTTRLPVALPELPDVGIWLLVTHGFYAAVELAGTADLLAATAAAGLMLPALLAIEKRSVKRPGQGKKEFPVPIIRVTASMAELSAGRGVEDMPEPYRIVAAVTPARPALPPGPPPPAATGFLSAGPPPVPPRDREVTEHDMVVVDDDPGPAPEIRPQGAPAPASASTSASPAAAAARPVAAAPAPDSGPPARPDALLTAMAAPLTFEQFQDEIERHAEVTHDDVVMAARIRFPGTKYISKLDDDQRGRLLVEAITQAEARMAAAASA